MKAATGEVVTRRGARRRRRPHARSRASPTTSPTTTRMRSRSRAASSANLNRAKHAAAATARAERAAVSRRGDLRRHPGRHAQALRRARGHRAASSTARELDEFKARYGTTLVTGFAHLHGYAGRRSSPTTASCSPSPRSRARTSSSSRCQRGMPLLFLQNITGFMVGKQVRGRRHRQRRREDGDRGGHREGAEVHGDHRRLVRRRQLRHVRARLLAALPVDVAERAHLRHGRRAGGSGARDRQRDGIERAAAAGRRRGSASRRRSASSTSARAIPTTRARGSGTTASSTRPTRAACWASRSRRRSTRRSRTRASACSGCKRGMLNISDRQRRRRSRARSIGPEAAQRLRRRV